MFASFTRVEADFRRDRAYRALSDFTPRSDEDLIDTLARELSALQDEIAEQADDPFSYSGVRLILPNDSPRIKAIVDARRYSGAQKWYRGLRSVRSDARVDILGEGMACLNCGGKLHQLVGGKKLPNWLLVCPRCCEVIDLGGND